MTVLQRRIYKLEGCFPPVIEADRTGELQVLALAQLPIEQLELLRVMLIRHDPPIPENEVEEEAVRHCNEVLAEMAEQREIRN